MSPGRTGWWEAVLCLLADPLAGMINWPPQHGVDIAVMESAMSYRVGCLGVVRSVMRCVVLFVLMQWSSDCVCSDSHLNIYHLSANLFFIKLPDDSHWP